MSGRDEPNQSNQFLKIKINIKNGVQLPLQRLENQQKLQNPSANAQDFALLLKEDIQSEDSLNEEDSSNEEAERLRDLQIKHELVKQTQRHSANHKMVVGTGFSMDVTQFFQFQKKKQLSSEGGQSLFQEISGSRWAWIILLYSVATGAIMPGWIMNIKANKILRISWRFFMQTVMVIPFVLYQYRTCDDNARKKYHLQHIFDPKNMIKPLISALATSIWSTTIIFGFEWTSISHSIVMGSLSNFFLSFGRSYRKSSHDLQSGGQMFVILGIILVLIDTIKWKKDYLSAQDYTVSNTFYYDRQWWERITFDLASLTMSCIISQFSKYTSDLKYYYPPFLSMFIVNTLICAFMCLSSFFLHGCSFDLDTFWGIWSLFSSQHFTGFMFMAIIIFLGQIVSLFLITRMFPDPIIPALALTLQPFIATLFLDLTDVQRIPGRWTFVGYTMIVPGMCLILVGQCLFQRISNRQHQQEQRSVALLRQLRQIQAKLEERVRRKERRDIKSKNISRIKSNSMKQDGSVK